MLDLYGTIGGSPCGILSFMKRVESREGEGRVFSTYTYENGDQALEAYAALTDEQRLAMAKVYQEAFGGYPWFEVFKCNQCDEFTKTNDSCSHCGGASFSEAYPLEWLVNEYFPHMMGAYTPGVLVILEDGGRMIGFTTGGAIGLGQLIQDKYKGKPEILASIIGQTGVSPEAVVFYENETCISATSQQKGSGGKLNLARIEAASEIGFPLICGRSVNQPWISLKERQLTGLGYDFMAFGPDGDTYEVDGMRRQFFMARRRSHG